jgi:hypothetical protein
MCSAVVEDKDRRGSLDPWASGESRKTAMRLIDR